MTDTIKLGTEQRQTNLEWIVALDSIKEVASKHRDGLVRALEREGPSVVGCAHGRWLIMFVQDGALRVDRYDSKANRVARYRL